MTNTDSSRVTRTKTTLTYLARKTVLTTGSTLDSNVVPVFYFDKNLKSGHLDEGQIQQVFSNLTINAIQAMPDSGHLHVSLENANVSQGTIVGLAGC